MFFDYEINTRQDIEQAIQELESYLDAGHRETVYIKRDLNTLYEWLQEIDVSHKEGKKERRKKKNNSNRYRLNRLHKRKLEKLHQEQSCVTYHNGSHIKRVYVSARRAIAKRESNVAVRNYMGTIPNGGGYRKLSPYWHTIY